MASNLPYPTTLSAPLTGIVGDPGLASINDGNAALAIMGKGGMVLEDSVHGQYFQAAKRGNLYMSATAVAGVTIPAPATTLASKAGIHNPLGSGVDVELVGLGISSVTIEVALKNFAMEFQINASTTGGTPTSVTKLTAYSQPLSTGKKTAQAYAYTAATMTNAAANPLVLPLFGNYETAVGVTPTWFPMQGIVMGPDTVMCITNVAALAAVQVVYLWAEWPV